MEKNGWRRGKQMLICDSCGASLSGRFQGCPGTGRLCFDCWEQKKKPIANQIEYATRQFEVYKMQALYWQAMAMTGAATMRDLAQGRPATTEERAVGITIGFDELTPEQKVKEALDTMNRFIHLMRECNDTISELKEKL